MAGKFLCPICSSPALIVPCVSYFRIKAEVYKRMRSCDNGHIFHTEEFYKIPNLEFKRLQFRKGKNP